MKQIKLILLTWFIVGYGAVGVALAQRKGEIQFQFKSTDRLSHVQTSSVVGVYDTRVSEVFEYEKTNKDPRYDISIPYSPILLGVRLNPELSDTWAAEMNSMNKIFRSFIIPNGSEVTLIAMGINSANVKDYRYRVVENDSTEIVHWSPITSLQQNFGAKQPYGFVGAFKAVNKQLMIEVVNINNYNIREGVVLSWRTDFRPVINQLLVSTPGAQDQVETFPSNKRSRPLNFDIRATAVNRGMATRFNKETDMPLDMHFNVDSVEGIALSFKNHVTVTYTIYLIKQVSTKTDTAMLSYSVNDNMFLVEKKLFNQAGKYEVIVQRAGGLGQWPESQVIRIPFEVKQPPVSEKKVSVKQLIPYAIAVVLVIAVAFYLYRRQSTIRLRRVAQEKEVVGLKLRSIRAQLNPHFMFNALTSIQNLINKNNITGANYYLSKFAGLTRQVLDSSNEEMLSLEDELKVLTDYLQMEQLRFNFKYEVRADEQLDSANIEIPAMLMQPFVENAIKHGIAGLDEDGRIVVKVYADKNDLLLSVTDNGAGFTRDVKAGGYGIKLSEDRVTLLNQIYKDQTVTLSIDGTTQGTTVTVRLSNWI
jgi:two-component system LytT family sensor kinase